MNRTVWFGRAFLVLVPALLVGACGAPESSSSNSSRTAPAPITIPTPVPVVPTAVPPPPTPAPKNGYKEFKWGDSLAAVKTKGATDLEPRSEGGDFDFLIGDSYLYFNGNSGGLMREVNPVQYFEGSQAWYESKVQKMRFLFLNEKLAAVRLSYMGSESLAPELEAQYGSAPSSVVADSEIRAWKQIPGRIIFWRVVVAGLEEVFYVDSEVYSALEQRALQERAKMHRPKPVLD